VILRAHEDDDYVCKAASNVKEAAERIEAGYEYVCDVDNAKLFRKRKRVYGFIQSLWMYAEKPGMGVES
jgi:hypothetical protein